MNNKGFTLIEIIIVMALIGALSVVIGVNMTTSLNNQKEKEKNEYKEKLQNAACIYVDHVEMNLTGCTNAGNCLINISDLINAGLIDKKLSNPYSKNTTVANDTTKIKVYLDSGIKKCEYMGGE